MMDTKHTESHELKILKTTDSGSKPEASDESSSLLEMEEESVAPSSQHSSRASRQSGKLGPSTKTQNKPLQEERIEVMDDHTGDTPSAEKGTPIFEAVALGDHETLSDLLTNCTTEFDTVDSEGDTVLHRAVTSACKEGDSDENSYKCVDLLMSCQKIKLNLPNKKGYTALGLALGNLDKKCVVHMLRHPSADRLYLEYYPGDRETTLREIIMETYPDLQPLLPGPIMKSLDSSDRDLQALAALQHDEYNIFRETLRSNNPNPWYDEPYHSSLLEIACQMKDRKRFVELLLKNRADPNIQNSVTGMPLIHATARSGNFEVLKILLETIQRKEEIIITNLKDVEERTILHWLASLSARKSKDKRKLKDCLNLLLSPGSSWKVNTEDRDRWGNTALYIAVERGYRDRAKLLLSKGADVRVFERGSKILLSDSLSVVKEILDDCLQHNNKPLTSKDLQLKLNYQSLMNIVPQMAESEFHSDLLAHPVISTFLNIKWEKVRIIFFLYVAFYVTFLGFLTVYILYSETYNTLNDGGAARNTTDTFNFNDINITSGMIDNNFTKQPNITSDMNDSNAISQQNMSFLLSMRVFLMALLTLLCLRETVQLDVHRWGYVKSPENLLEILLIIVTFISCSGMVDGTKIKSHFSAIALFLGWLELLLMLGRLPLLSVQQKMFRSFSRTFFKFLATYVPLLIAFALSFYIIFKDSAEPDGTKHFPNPLLSLPKTIIMFSGELEATSLSFDSLPGTSHVIFILFVVLVAIILLNLMNGVAIYHTEQIIMIAERLSLVARARLIFRIKRLVNALPEILKPDIELKEETFVIYPNMENRIGSTAVQSLLSKIREKMKPDENDKSTGIQEELRRLLNEKFSELELIQKNQGELLYSVLGEMQQNLLEIRTHLGNWESEITRAEI